MKSLPFAEFFAGIGLVRAGLGPRWRCEYANDIDPFKAKMYRAMFPDDQPSHLHLCDIWDTDAVAARVGSPFLATASFPCTDVSLCGMQRGLDGKGSGAFWAFALVLRRMLSEGRTPRLLMLENVHGFATGNGGRDLRAACSELSSIGYALDAFALDARHFLSQSRPRLFVVGALGWDGKPNRGPRPEALRLRALSEVMESMPDVRWMGLRAAPPPELSCRVESVLDPDGDWWPGEQVEAHLAKMDPIHLARLAGPEPIVACGFRRTRRGAARLEVRTDGLAGCLRTPRGGSGRQVVVRSEGGRVRMRWMTSVEYARLQGARHCGPVVSERQALFGYGDAVCVPAVSWLDQEILSPLAEHLLRPRAAGAGTSPSAASPTPATDSPSG
jgi:DNA (cytosine-5)-methyltransferase 1